MNKYIRLLPMLFIWLTAMSARAADWPFAVQAVNLTTIQEERVFDGVVEPVNQSTVSAQTSGRIVEINFDVDDVVPKDSVLIRIHDVEQQALLKQAQASLLEARAREKEAAEEYRRVQGLVAKNLASKADLDRAQADQDATRAAISAAQARVAQAEEQVGYTVVRAPYAGVVVERHVELGESVNSGQPLMTGFSLESLRVVAAISQDIVQHVRAAPSATVEFAHQLDLLESDHVKVFPFAHPSSHTFKVRVGLPVGVKDIYPGMLGKVRFAIGEMGALLVPGSAVVQRSEVTGVYVVDEVQQRVAFRRVVTGKPVGEQLEVLAGLEPGETVALDPVAAGIFLKDSQQQQ